jgi:pimeloyl-[acyl-carrier protein] methyl ester esterase
MDVQGLTLLLLPGMDGTGDLFANFVPLLPSWIKPRVVRYPRDQKLTYDQLLPILKLALPSDEPFVALAESFSTPLAVMFAAERPKGLRALVLCAGFVSPPRRNVFTQLALFLAPVLFSFGLPKSVCRYFLVGDAAPTALVNEVRAAVSGVPGRVLAHRFRSVLSCNVERELRSVSIPLLYISGYEDRLVRISSFKKIQQTSPGALLATVGAPHLILQSKPHEVLNAVLPILEKIWGEVAR